MEGYTATLTYLFAVGTVLLIPLLGFVILGRLVTGRWLPASIDAFVRNTALRTVAVLGVFGVVVSLWYSEVDGVDFGGVEQGGKDCLDIFFVKANCITVGKLHEDRLHRFDEWRNIVFLRQFDHAVVDAQIVGAQAGLVQNNLLEVGEVELGDDKVGRLEDQA